MPEFLGDVNQLDPFKEWLVKNGAEIRTSNNPWELLRFKCLAGVGVLYAGKKTYSVNDDLVNDAFTAFQKAGAWNGFQGRTRRLNKFSQKKTLAARDGKMCFYCGDFFALKELTQEHILSLCHGGNNRLENKVLACLSCNQEANNLSVMDKVKLRDSKRGYTSGTCG